MLVTAAPLSDPFPPLTFAINRPLRQSARSLKGQGEELASAIGETAARAKDTIAEKSAETWDSTKDKIQEWTEQAGEQLVATSSKAKSAGDAILQSARRQQHDLR